MVDDDQHKPDPSKVLGNPDALKHAHDRTGRLLKQAGLPFEEDEFDDAAGEETAGGETAGAADVPSRPGENDEP